jgi:hypothetical protein
MSKILNVRLPASATTTQYNAQNFNQLVEALKLVVNQLNTTYTPQATEDNQSELEWFGGTVGPALRSTLEDRNSFANGLFYSVANQTCTTINTATPIDWDVEAITKHIALDPTDSTKLAFQKSGRFLLAFSAELRSTSSSAKIMYFWPRINGTDVPGSTMVNVLDSNNMRKTVSRVAIFDVNKGDYLQAMWAVDTLTAYLEAVPATAFCPAAPSAVLSILGVQHGQ